MMLWICELFGWPRKKLCTALPTGQPYKAALLGRQLGLKNEAKLSNKKCFDDHDWTKKLQIFGRQLASFMHPRNVDLRILSL